MKILKKTDLMAVRDANMRIVKDKENLASAIAGASQIIIRLRDIELKTEAEIITRRTIRSTDSDVKERLVDSLDHVSSLRIVG